MPTQAALAEKSQSGCAGLPVRETAAIERERNNRKVSLLHLKETMNACHDSVSRQPKLLQVVFTLSPPSGLTCLLHGGQQQCNQNGDDRNHHQQFNQSESRTGSSVRFHCSIFRERIGLLSLSNDVRTTVNSKRKKQNGPPARRDSPQDWSDLKGTARQR